MPPGKSDSLLTLDEPIEYSKISEPTFQRDAGEGRTKAINLGKGWRILESEFYPFFQVEETCTEKRTANKFGSSQTIAIQKKE
jgi:hypothetical protein